MDFSNFKTIAIDGQEVKQLAINGDVVWVKPSESIPASITLSVDNPVIMTGETATIQALVLDANNNPCSGVEVSFNSDIANTTSQTDSNGVAEYGYVGVGYGDLTISATVGGLTDSVSIEDYIRIGFNGQDTFSKFNESDALLTVNINDGILISPVNTGRGTMQCDNTFQTDGDWQVIFDIQYSGSQGGLFGIKPHTTNHSSQSCAYISWDNSLLVGGSKNISTARSQTSAGGTATNKNTVKFVSNGTNVQIYVNNNLKHTISSTDWTHSDLTMYASKWNNGVTGFTVSNLKIKKIS